MAKCSWCRTDSMDKKQLEKILQRGVIGRLFGVNCVRNPKWWKRFCEIGISDWQFERHYKEIEE